MKKIMFYLPSLNVGGAESVSVNILNEIECNSNEIFLITNDDSGFLKSRVNDYVKVISLRTSSKYLSLIRMIKLIKEIEPDIIYSTLFRSHMLLSVIKFITKSKAKYIFRSPNSPQRLKEYKQLSWFEHNLISLCYKYCHVVIAQTPEMKDEIADIYKVDANKIKVMINPIDSKYINKCLSEDCNLSLCFDENKFNIVASGRITEQKGFDILIDAMVGVIQEKSNVHLYILGEDVIGLQKELELKAYELDLSESITFLGFVENPYVYYKYCDLFVSSSRWEGLPNTLIECRYLNTKVVATKSVPFINELIEDGVDGLIVPELNSLSIQNTIIDSFNLTNLKSKSKKSHSKNSVIFEIF
ncbi:glycosyltransferase [Vibrio cyclitrophicus]|uniref:glycosyltransferase n=1 Tax=Vibrio cyclitrophicus TaxID=47951 RepID=UPI00030DE356|nr:glycosyltransferase [Vibrio cyclitrophicus]OEF29289.1 hypothetical protein OA9_23630 [Vibrio cyclitrophicus 1F97]